LSRHLEVFAIPGVPRIAAGDDLASMICARTRLRSGDVLAVTSKVVSKSEGRVRQGGRDVAVDAEVDRVVARRGATVIARTRTGLVLAAAGVDASNVDVGNVVLLPLDPDSSARALRERVATIAGVDVAVVVTDTAGRAWRVGQTDIAIGCAGLAPLDDHAGRHDPFGNVLQVTAPAIADEVAAAADLVKGKTGSTPVAVLRGTPLVVLPRGEHGPGAAALVRDPAEDLFGLGSRTQFAQRHCARTHRRWPLSPLKPQHSRSCSPWPPSSSTPPSRSCVVSPGGLRARSPSTGASGLAGWTSCPRRPPSGRPPSGCVHSPSLRGGWWRSRRGPGFRRLQRSMGGRRS
jgi:coenzyme F420-0:L-glutamate ligase/coenzyme F420-1:gamma-L-glutamate ligase